MPEEDDSPTDNTTLEVFVQRQGDDGWRTYVRPGWQPRYLRQHLDDRSEAYPVYLDFRDLDQHMREHHAEYEKVVNTVGDVALNAKGMAAEALATWFAGAFATGIRPKKP